MSKRTEYPKWAVEMYGFPLKKIDALDKLATILTFTGIGVICLAMLLGVVLSFAHNFTDSMTILTLSLVIIGGCLMLIGVAIDTFFFLKKVRFGRDWLMLQEITTYKNDIADLQSYYLTQSNAYDVMITTAVKVRMAELAKDKQEAAIKRAELVENYRLLMKFKLVETVDNPDEPENFPLRPYFDAAEPKVTETLAFMVTRQKRQSQGLPI